MTVLVLIETALLVVLSVLVAGLLRGYASVLARLHRLDGGAHGPGEFQVSAPVAVDAPEARAEWAEAHDVSGETLAGELVTSRVAGVEHDTVLTFLSSGCSSCEVFWQQLSRPDQVRLPLGTRLMVITLGPEADSRAALAELAPPGVDVVMSTEAWRRYEVPGSPYVVLVDGRTGRIRGEGTGQSWQQISGLLATASGDSTYLTGGPSTAKPRGDAEREADADRQLLMAGILPGDPRLYEAGEP